MRHRTGRTPAGSRRAAAAALTALGLALAGCGSGSDPGGDGSGAAGSPSAGGAEPSLHASLPPSVQSSGLLRFAGDSHPPYRTVGADGSVTGIDKDFQDALGAVLGVKTETTIVASLPAALEGMLADRYDAFNGPVKATAEREQQFDSITWMVTRTSYVVPKDAAGTIKAAADLCGHKVALVSGSIVEGQVKQLTAYCAKSGKPAVETVGLADTNATLLAVRSGRADASGMTETAALDVLNKQKDAFSYVTQTAEEGASVDNLALLVPKAGGLGPVMLRAFQELFANGEYRKIMDKWGLSKVTVDEPVLNAGSAK